MISVSFFVLFIAFVVGLALGAVYFFILWRTVRKLPDSSNPNRLMIISFLMRMAMALAVFYLIIKGEHWERFAVALLGFLLMRKIITYSLGHKEQPN